MSKDYENSDAYKQAMTDAADIVRAKIRELQEPFLFTMEDGTTIKQKMGEYAVPSLITIEKVFRNRAKGDVNGK